MPRGMELRHWVVTGSSVVGHVYGDARHYTGQLITTARVLSWDGEVATTRSGSRYRLRRITDGERDQVAVLCDLLDLPCARWSGCGRRTLQPCAFPRADDPWCARCDRLRR
jgi:hypothetical protein